MKVRFWGVRGSIPSPDPGTVRYGGNTSCTEIESDDGNIIILDTGTGIRKLGLHMLNSDHPGYRKQITLLISHAHWDHIQGFPFFIPAYLPNFSFKIYCSKQIEPILRGQMNHPYFPVTLDVMKAKMEFGVLANGSVKAGDCTVSSRILNHPQEVYGYKFACGKKAVVHSSDTEHTEGKLDQNLVEFSKNAECLIYDAQYTPDEYKNGKVGWGHSTYIEGVKVAKAAKAKQLVLFHHDPIHTDAFLDGLQEKTRELFPNSLAAYEGLELVF